MNARFVRFGVVELDGERYERDVVVDRGAVSRRNKAASKPHRERYGHTPLTLAEGIPWDCRQLIVGTGADGALPILDEVREEARRRGVELASNGTDVGTAHRVHERVGHGHHRCPGARRLPDVPRASGHAGCRGPWGAHWRPGASRRLTRPTGGAVPRCSAGSGLMVSSS